MGLIEVVFVESDDILLQKHNEGALWWQVDREQVGEVARTGHIKNIISLSNYVIYQIFHKIISTILLCAALNR